MGSSILNDICKNKISDLYSKNSEALPDLNPSLKYKKTELLLQKTSLLQKNENFHF